MNSRSRVKLLALLGSALTSACGAGDAPEEISVSRDNLFGRVTYESTSDRYVPPFTAAYIERSMFHARTVAASNAFSQCVANTMNAQYMNCSDPGPQSSPSAPADRSGQITAAWNRFSTWSNSMSFGVRPQSDFPNASASAPYETSAPYATHHVTVYDGYAANFSDWFAYAAPEPWHWRAADLIHEYMHTVGYKHTDDATPQQACASANARSSYYALGEPSAPYIYGGCASQVVVESHRLCGDIHVGCPAGSLKQLVSWTGGVGNVPQPANACTCVQDPAHTIALRTTSNQAVTASSGGGGSLVTNWTQSIGAWQWFYVHVLNAQQWSNNGSIQMKAFNGNFTRVSSSQPPGVPYTADGPSPFTVSLGGSGAPSFLGDGSVVTLKALSSYACDVNGGLWKVSQSIFNPAPNNCYFTIVEPRRDKLVYIKGWHGRYLNLDSSGLLWNQRTDSELGLTNSGIPPAPELAAEAAFWIIDWNGGNLENGDWVSLERYKNDSHEYVSVADGDHHGQPRIWYDAGPYEKFQILRQTGGSGPIAHNDDIAVATQTGTFLTAMSSDYSNQVVSSATWVLDWEHFRIKFVEQYDRSRPAW